MDYIVIAWYYSAQLVYGEVEYILNQYYSYLHRVLARDDPEGGTSGEFWAKVFSSVSNIMSLWTPAEQLGGIILCHCYLERLSIWNFCRTTSITEYWQGMIPDLIYCDWYWSIKVFSYVSNIMSSWTTAERLGGIILCYWYLEGMSISNFCRTAFITKYWQGMIPYLIYCLVLIHKSILLCQ